MQPSEISMWALLVLAVTVIPATIHNRYRRRRHTRNSNRVSNPPLTPQPIPETSPMSDLSQLPPVTERQALDAFIGAVALMRARAMPIPTLLEFADIQAQNTVPTLELATPIA